MGRLAPQPKFKFILGLEKAQRTVEFMCASKYLQKYQFHNVRMIQLQKIEKKLHLAN